VSATATIPRPPRFGPESGGWIATVGLFLGVSFLVRLALSATYFGFLTGDDVEILEAGLRWATHLPYIPWEIRNTLLPTLLVAPMGALGVALGAHSPRVLCWLATVPFALLSTLNIGLTYRLVLALSGDRLAALLGGLLLGSHWVAVGFGSTVYPRTASTTCILLAALLVANVANVANAERGFLTRLAAGGLVALAFAFRYSEAIFLVPVLLLAARSGAPPGRVRRAAAVTTGFVLGGILFVGVVDFLEWGSAFSSLRAFFDYTFVERSASSLVAVQPAYWYLWVAHRWISPAALGGVLLLRRHRVPPVLLGFVLVPLALLSLIHHKELRYLQGVLPFLCALGGFGLAFLWRAGWRRVVVGLFALSIGWSGVHLRFLGKKSMAAVVAAEYVASTGQYRTVAAQQPWALGDRLILGQRVGVKELPMRLAAEELRREVMGVDAVVLYTDLLTDELADSLVREGFCLQRGFSWGRSRPVALFATCSATP